MDFDKMIEITYVVFAVIFFYFWLLNGMDVVGRLVFGKRKVTEITFYDIVQIIGIFVFFIGVIAGVYLFFTKKSKKEQK